MNAKYVTIIRTPLICLSTNQSCLFAYYSYSALVTTQNINVKCTPSLNIEVFHAHVRLVNHKQLIIIHPGGVLVIMQAMTCDVRIL